MSCFSELEYSIYVDGESTAEEARRIEGHLAACGRCRDLVGALREENRALAALLLDQDEVEAAASAAAGARSRLLIWELAAVAATIAAMRAVSLWLEQVDVPAALGWLNPFSPSFGWNLATSSLFFAVEQGLRPLWSALAQVVASILGILFFTWLVGRLWRRLPARALLGLTLAFTAGLPGQALERRHAHNIIVQKSETIDDNLLVAGESVRMDGEVNGDLIAFARRLEINGRVHGNVITFCRNLEVRGPVDGDVFTFSQSAHIAAAVAHNVTGFAQNLALDPDGRVGRDLTTFAAEADLDGSIGGDLISFTESANLRGDVGRNVVARSRRISLTAPARVGGNLTVYLPRKENLDIGAGATVSGKTETRLIQRRSRYARPGFYVWEAITLLGAWLTGLVLAWLFPGALPTGFATGRDAATHAAFGFVALVAVPAAAILVALTLIGLPLGLIALVLWCVALYLGKIFFAAATGRAVAGEASPTALAVPLLLGLMLVWVAADLPYVGGLLKFVINIVGLGMVYAWVRTRWRPAEAIAPTV